MDVDEGAAIAPGKRSLTERLGMPNRRAATTPGKRALTDSLPVQRRAAAPEHGTPLDGATAGQVAGESLAGASGALPHAEAIQRSFGRFDILSTQTVVGGRAVQASEAMGATAFAQGNRVGFANAPDLRTAAHEAAHVVQQRSGHAPAGGLDTPGDHLERHADQVADAVVAGHSAEGLLEQLGSGAATTGVQRDGNDKQKVGETNPDYVNTNRNKLIIAIMDRVDVTPLTRPHPRLVWHDETHAKTEIGLAISRYVRADDSTALKRMMMLSYPADLFELVDAARRGPEGSRFDAVKIAIGTAFDEPLVASIQRMGTRAIVQYDAHQKEKDKKIAASSIVASCPLDSVIAELLVNDQLVTYTPAAKGAADDTGGKPFAKGLRSVMKYEWQGVHDPEMWNWIKVIDPKDATVEEVANIALAGGEYGDVEQAYRIAASPPFFGIPFETARLIKDATTFAPESVMAKLQTGPGPRVADGTKLAASTLSDEAAVAQAPSPAKGDPPATKSLERIQTQLGFMNNQLFEWQLNNPLGSAMNFAIRRYTELHSDKKAATKWAPVLAAQERILYAAASELTELLDDVAKTGAKPADAPQLGPVTQLLRAYAHVGEVSHLHAEATAALAEARRLKTLLPLSLAEDRIRSARGDVTTQREVEKGIVAEDREPYSDKTPTDVNDQLTRAADLRLQAAHGGSLDPDAVEKLSLDASTTSLRSRLVILATQARQIMRRSDEVGLPQDTYAGGYWSPYKVSKLIVSKVNDPVSMQQKVANDTTGGGWQERLDNAAKWTQLDSRRNELKRIGDDVEKFKTDLDLEKFLKWAYEQIADQQLRNLIWDMALQLGIAIVTGEAVGAAAAAIRGIALAGEIGAELREASLLYKAGEVVATAGANTLSQGAVGGEVSMRSFAENALGIVLTNAAMKPFQGLLHDSAAVEGEIRTWGQLAKRGGKVAAELVIETGASIGASGLAHAVTHGGDVSRAGAEEWINMGVSIAAARFVHQRTQGMQHRIVELSRELATKKFDNILGKSVKLEAKSNIKDGQKIKPETALELLQERHELLIEERNAYREEPKAQKALDEANKELAATGAQFADVPLQLAHLSPVVEGHVYEGSAAQIEKAFAKADATGVPLTREWLPKEGIWRVTSGDRVIEIHETSGHHDKAGSRAAHAVPDSSFSGTATQGGAKITPEQARTKALEAATILDGATGNFLWTDGNSIWVSVGPHSCQVEIAVGDAKSDVATHTYKHGANLARITVSEHARLDDVTRAVGHELVEIQALMTDPTRKLTDDAALKKGSSSTDLSHHDLGRKAELDILLYQLENQPARRDDILKEINALIEHLGFDMATVRKDARAKKVLSEETILRLDAAVGRKRLWVTADKIVPTPRYNKGDPAWKFSLDVPIPGAKEPVNLGFGDCPVDASGHPIRGPEYGLNKRTTIGGEEVRITIGDGTKSQSLTDLVVKLGNEAFAKTFGHPPTELGGHLMEDNRTIFQREYLKQIDAKVDPATAAVNALKLTPFGRARFDAGYTEITFEPFTMEKIVYGDPPQVREVPQTIKPTMKKK